MSVESHDIHKKVYSTLLKGVILQITGSIRDLMSDVPIIQQILFYVPSMLLMKILQAPAILQNLAHSIVLDTTLALVEMPDVGLSFFNLVSVFLCSLLFEVDDVGNAAQYILATRLGDTFGVNAFIQVLVPVIFYCNSRFFQKIPVLHDTVSLVCMYMFQQWLLAQIPKNFRLPCILIVLYGIVPFMKKFPSLVDFLNFLMVSVTRELQMSGIPYWIQIIFFVFLWVGSSDTILVSLGQMTALRLIQLVVMSMVISLARTDAFFVYGVMFITFDFLVNKIT